MHVNAQRPIDAGKVVALASGGVERPHGQSVVMSMLSNVNVYLLQWFRMSTFTLVYFNGCLL